jgi:hypothetical protein
MLCNTLVTFSSLKHAKATHKVKPRIRDNPNPFQPLILHRQLLDLLSRPPLRNINRHRFCQLFIPIIAAIFDGEDPFHARGGSGFDKLYFQVWDSAPVKGEDDCVLVGENFRKEGGRGVVSGFGYEGGGTGEGSAGWRAGDGGDGEFFGGDEGVDDEGAKVARCADDGDVFDLRWDCHFEVVDFDFKTLYFDDAESARSWGEDKENDAKRCRRKTSDIEENSRIYIHRERKAVETILISLRHLAAAFLGRSARFGGLIIKIKPLNGGEIKRALLR